MRRAIVFPGAAAILLVALLALMASLRSVQAQPLPPLPVPATFSFDAEDHLYDIGEEAAVSVEGLTACSGEPIRLGFFDQDGNEYLTDAATVDDEGNAAVLLAVTTVYEPVYPGATGDCIINSPLVDFEQAVVFRDEPPSPGEVTITSDNTGAFISGEQAIVTIEGLEACAGERIHLGYLTASGDEFGVQPVTVNQSGVASVSITMLGSGGTAYPGATGDCIEGGFVLDGQQRTDLFADDRYLERYTYDLSFRWTLFTWAGEDGTPIEGALNGVGTAGGDIRDDVTVIWYWSAADQAYLGYFPDAPRPGINDITTFENGNVYWLALAEDAATGDEPDVYWPTALDYPEPGEAPLENVAGFLQRMDEHLAATGKVLSIEATTGQYTSDGTEYIDDISAWFDFSSERARIEYHTRPAGDEGSSWLTLEFVDGGDLYEKGLDDDRPQLGWLYQQHNLCMPGESPLAVIIACGIAAQPGNFELWNTRPIDETTWNGQPAIGLAYDWVQHIDPNPPPGSVPTDPPTSPRPTYTAWRKYEFYVDPETYLPLGMQVTTDRSDTGERGTIAVAFDSQLVDRDEAVLALLDPRNEGYLSVAEIEMDLLDHPMNDAPVYWLGREHDAGGDIGTLTLDTVEQWYHPQRPTLVTLKYEGAAGGTFKLEMWEEAGWQAYLDSLQSSSENLGVLHAFDERCLEVEETTIAGHAVRVLKGHEAQPGLGASTPPWPLDSEPCPPRSVYLLEFHADGYVAVLNAPVSLWALAEQQGAYNSPQDLLTIAEGLRLRHDGE